MSNIQCDCRNLCCYEFDTVGLYLNFKDKSLWDVRYAIDKWCQLTKVDLKDTTIVYNQMNLTDCQKYGQFKNAEYLAYLESISPNRYNFYTDFYSQETDDYIRMYNYLVNTKSIIIFFGDIEGTKYKNEFEQYKINNCRPIITITPNEYCDVFWVGITDKQYDYMNYRYYYK